MLDKDNQPLSYWWSIPSDQLIETLKINLQEGLTKNQVQASRVHVGSNKLYTHKPTNIVTLVLEGVQEHYACSYCYRNTFPNVWSIE